MRDFAEIAHLDTAGLRALLDEGAAPERVRAAWAHALDEGQSLLKAMREEDFPRETIRSLLEDFTRRGRRLAWEHLHPFTSREWPEVDVWLTELLDADAPAEANTWLLKVVSSRLESKPGGALDARGRELARELLALLEEERRETLARHLEECDASRHEECLLEAWGFESARIALRDALASPSPR